MRYCSRCGVPRILTNEHSWGSNGTLYLTNDPAHRMVILDNDALTNVFNSISERIGIGVDNIVAEAKRKSAKHFMDAVLAGVKGVVARNLASTKVYQQLSHQVSMLGAGHSEVTSYERHRHLEGVVTDAYNGPALTGDISGAFESVENRAAEYEFEVDESGTLRLTVRASSLQRPEYADRFKFEPIPALPGRNIFELCPVCKAPTEIGRQYEFDMDRGIIREPKAGHRVVLMGVTTLRNIFGELEAELGDEIPNMMMTTEKERVRRVIEEKGKMLETGELGYLRYMKTLRPKGMGNGVLARVSGGRVNVRIDNPYSGPLLAGFLAGFYEATSGAAASVEWTVPVQGSMEITLSPS